MNKLRVSAGIKATEGADLEVVKKELYKLEQATQHEPNCYQFEINQRLDNPRCFTLWETWEDEAALAAHFKATHTLNYLAQNLTEVVYIEKLKVNR